MASPWREPRQTLWRDAVDAADAARRSGGIDASGSAVSNSAALGAAALASAFAPPPGAHAPVWHVGPRYMPPTGVAHASPGPPEAEFWSPSWDCSANVRPPCTAPPPLAPAPRLAPHDVGAVTATRGAAPFVPPAVRPFSLPRRLQLPAGARVAGAACGEAHALLLLRSGDALALGANEAGQLGSGDRAAASTPRVITLPRACGPLAAVAAHGDRSAAAAASGDVARWGRHEEAAGVHTASEPLPTLLHWLDGAASTRVTSLALGAAHALLLTSAGAVFALGAGCASGQLGLGPSCCDAPRPRRLERLRGADVAAVAAGASHSAALTRSGVLFTWGCGGSGRLGHGSEGTAQHADAHEPRPVRHPAWLAPAGAPPDGPGAAVAAEAAAQRRRAALLSDPRTQQLALLPRAGAAAAAAAEEPFAQPAEARLDAALRAAGATAGDANAANLQTVVAVACGGEHTLALMSSGDVYAWGANGRGQLGAGAGALGACEARPRRVRALLGTRCVAVAAGDAHSAAVAADGRAFVWGAGDQGQLGSGGTRDEPTPMPLPPPPPPAAASVSVAAGGDARHAAAAAGAADAAAAHPLAGARLGGVACGAASTLLWTDDGAAAWACGAGAFGLPGARLATAGGAATAAPLADEHSAGVAAFAVAAVREMSASKADAAPRREALLRAGPFDGAALAHVLRAVVDCSLADQLSAHVHAATALALARRGARCSRYAFRRALVDAVEDAGVRLLAACRPGEFAHAGVDAPPLEATGGEAALRASAAALRRVLRALGAYGDELLSGEDAADLAAGCPGGRHSAALPDTALAARKAAFFRDAVPPEMAPPHALATLGLKPLRACGTEADAARAAAAEAQARREARPLAENLHRVPLPPGTRRFESALFGASGVAAPVGLAPQLGAPAVTAAAVENAAADALRAAMLAAAAAGVSAAELTTLSQFAAAPTMPPPWQTY